jgi:putative ABC transport system permease protein
MLLYNLRLAWGSVRRYPVLSALILLGIALGVAVSTTFLTVYHVLSQDPIPGKSDRLFYVRLDAWGGNQPYSDTGEPPAQLTYRDTRAVLRSDIPVRQAAMFKAQLYVHPNADSHGAAQRPFRQAVRLTQSDFFPMFDVPFRYGSGWSRAADARPEQVAVISSALNDRLFGGADSVGRTVRIEGRDFTVAGVLGAWRPPVLFYDMTQNPNGEPEDIFLPLNWVEPMQIRTAGNILGWRSDDPVDDFIAGLQSSEMSWLQMWVQLDTPAQREAYQSFLDAYANDQKKAGRFPHPLNNRITPVVALMQEWQVVPPQARALALISLLFLIVAALNLVGLFLGKFLSRASIAGVRRALGASRRAIFVQHLVECEMVGLLGGACGLLLSLASLALVNRFYHPGGDGETFFHLDLPMVGAAILLSLVAAAVAGLYPAWRICAIPPARHLKNQ